MHAKLWLAFNSSVHVFLWYETSLHQHLHPPRLKSQAAAYVRPCDFCHWGIVDGILGTRILRVILLRFCLGEKEEHFSNLMCGTTHMSLHKHSSNNSGMLKWLCEGFFSFKIKTKFKSNNKRDMIGAHTCVFDAERRPSSRVRFTLSYEHLIVRRSGLAIPERRDSDLAFMSIRSDKHKCYIKVIDYIN